MKRKVFSGSDESSRGIDDIHRGAGISCGVGPAFALPAIHQVQYGMGIMNQEDHSLEAGDHIRERRPFLGRCL